MSDSGEVRGRDEAPADDDDRRRSRREDRDQDRDRDKDDEQGDADSDEEPDEDDDGKDADDDDKEDDGPHLYQKPIFWIVVGAIVLLLLVGGLLWWLHARRFESTDDAFVDAHVVRIAAQTDGQLTQVADADNRHVRRGQLIAVIEPGTPAASLREAEAGVLEADASIRQAQAQVLTQRASLRQARANALAPQADAARAARDYGRYLDLRRLDPLAAAPTQVDQARAQAQSTAAQALAARRQIGTAAANVLAAQRQVDAARAQRKAAEARVREAGVTVSYLRIRAPIDGQVVNRSVNVGSYVASGQQLMAIVPDFLWVTANFKETQLALMRRGQPVAIHVDAFPQAKLDGYVDSLQHGAGQAFALLPPQNATGNYVKVVQRVPVRILFRGQEWKKYPLGPGMSVVPRVTVRP